MFSLGPLCFISYSVSVSAKKQLSSLVFLLLFFLFYFIRNLTCIDVCTSCTFFFKRFLTNHKKSYCLTLLFIIVLFFRCLEWYITGKRENCGEAAEMWRKRWRRWIKNERRHELVAQCVLVCVEVFFSIYAASLGWRSTSCDPFTF